MTTALPDLRCTDEDHRRDEISHADDVQAIDYLEVTGSQLVLEVHFVAKATANGNQKLRDLLDDLSAHPAQVRITGGERVRHIAVRNVARSGRILRIRVSQAGDFSTYRLTIADARMDPAYASVAFSFKAGCPSRFDCAGDCECEEIAQPAPEIDYLAKDYRSFRQALIDRLPAIAPEWVERHEADLGMALLELIAYAGDQLSYQQDAVANESYLGSARQRVSVRRHARLVDYEVDEGASARAFVVATVTTLCVLPASSQLLTRRELPFEGHLPPLGAVLVPELTRARREARAEAAAIFETRADTTLHPWLNPIPIYAWDLADCCPADRHDVAGPGGRCRLASTDTRAAAARVGTRAGEPAGCRGDRGPRRSRTGGRRARPRSDPPPSCAADRRAGRHRPIAPQRQDHARHLVAGRRPDVCAVRQPARCRRRRDADRRGARQHDHRPITASRATSGGPPSRHGNTRRRSSLPRTACAAGRARRASCSRKGR